MTCAMYDLRSFRQCCYNNTCMAIFVVSCKETYISGSIRLKLHVKMDPNGFTMVIDRSIQSVWLLSW